MERRLAENEFRLENAPERHLKRVVPITSPPVIGVEKKEGGKGIVEFTVDYLDVERGTVWREVMLVGEVHGLKCSIYV